MSTSSVRLKDLKIVVGEKSLPQKALVGILKTDMIINFTEVKSILFIFFKYYSFTKTALLRKICEFKIGGVFTAKM